MERGEAAVRDEPTEISLAEYRRLTAKQPRKRAKQQRRADIPRAPRDEPTGLTDLLKAGWSPSSPDCVRYRLSNRDIGDTGLQPTLKDACDVAKALTRQEGRAE